QRLPDSSPSSDLPQPTALHIKGYASVFGPENGGLCPRAGTIDQYTPRYLSISQGETWRMYSSHSLRLASRKWLKMCSPSVSLTSASFSNSSRASLRF